MDWLSVIEERVNRLNPVAVDMDVIKTQHEELRPLNKEYREFGHHIDKVYRKFPVLRVLKVLKLA